MSYPPSVCIKGARFLKFRVYWRKLLNLVLSQEIGISIVTMPDGRVQLLHTFASAASQDDAEEGKKTDQ